MSKFMIRLLRHDDTVHREDDGAVRVDDLAELFKSRFAATSQRSIQAWLSILANGGGQKKRFQHCLNPNSSEHFLYFPAIQGHSGGTLVDPTLQDNALLPSDCAEYIYHIGNAHDMHSIIKGGWIPGGRRLERDRQSVFFTAVNPMYTHQNQEEVQYDLDKPRIAVCKNTWRVHQNTVYWCKVKLAQRKGLQFHQTRSHAIALFNTLSAICIEMKTGEDYTAKYTHPQGYRKSYSRQICNMDVRIFVISMREKPADHPSDQSATRKLVAHISRTRVASISKKITERSTRKLVAVIQTTA